MSDTYTTLESWILRLDRADRPSCPVRGRLRFAFYGRTSTAEYQDSATSYGWQYEAADGVINGHGVIVVQFFDVGCSRQRPWHDRYQASALLAAITNPDRQFDAIVVGEYERAFDHGQIDQLAPRGRPTSAGRSAVAPPSGIKPRFAKGSRK